MNKTQIHKSFPRRGFRLLIAVPLMAVACVVGLAQDKRQLTIENPPVLEKRTALVIGNGDYQNARKLVNPVNDATDMAAALREVGFDVISGTDLNLKQMNDKVRDFGDALKANGGGSWIITADHGNAETMIDPVTGGPHTYHTTNPVPLIYVSEPKAAGVRSGGALRDISPTILGILGIEKPADMTGEDLRVL